MFRKSSPFKIRALQNPVLTLTACLSETGHEKKVGFQVRDIMVVGEINLTVNYAVVPTSKHPISDCLIARGLFWGKECSLPDFMVVRNLNLNKSEHQISGCMFIRNSAQHGTEPHLVMVIRQGISPCHMRTHRKPQDNSVLSSLFDITAIHEVHDV